MNVSQPPFAFELHRRNLRLYANAIPSVSFGLGTTTYTSPAFKLDTGAAAGIFDRERGVCESVVVAGGTDIWATLSDAGAARNFWRRSHIIQARMQIGNPVNASTSQRIGIGLGNDLGVTPWPFGAATSPRIFFGAQSFDGIWEVVYRDGAGNDLITGVEPIVPDPVFPSNNFYHLLIAYVPNEYISFSVNHVVCLTLTTNDIVMIDPDTAIFYNNSGPTAQVHAGAGSGGVPGRFAGVFTSLECETFGTD